MLCLLPFSKFGTAGLMAESPSKRARTSKRPRPGLPPDLPAPDKFSNTKWIVPNKTKSTTRQISSVRASLTRTDAATSLSKRLASTTRVQSSRKDPFELLSMPRSEGQSIPSTSSGQRVSNISSASQPIPDIDFGKFSSNNVVFVFPHESRADRIVMLCSNADTLKRASPYWETMFESGYSESERKLERFSSWHTLLAKDLQDVLQKHKSSMTSLSILDDSDMEGCPAAPRRSDAEEGASTLAVRCVIVEDASSKAYRVLLRHIGGKTVSFAPLTSAAAAFRASSLPSPKSVYALAHKLGLESLQSKALSDISIQLSERNALQELFSSHAALYPEISAAAMKAAVMYMPKIKAAGGHNFIETVLAEGKVDMEYAAKMVRELIGKM